jgi:hypothetical protein
MKVAEMIIYHHYNSRALIIALIGIMLPVVHVFVIIIIIIEVPILHLK